MEFEEQYQDVLQNIEVGIMGVYREYPEMVDYDVERVLQTLRRTYNAEKQGKDAPNVQFNELRQQLFSSVKIMCDWRLGRVQLDVEGGEIPGLEPITIDEIIACLKRIELSVKRWNKRGGIRGYLSFIEEYVS